MIKTINETMPTAYIHTILSRHAASMQEADDNLVKIMASCDLPIERDFDETLMKYEASGNQYVADVNLANKKMLDYCLKQINDDNERTVHVDLWYKAAKGLAKCYQQHVTSTLIEEAIKDYVTMLNDNLENTYDNYIDCYCSEDMLLLTSGPSSVAVTTGGTVLIDGHMMKHNRLDNVDCVVDCKPQLHSLDWFDDEWTTRDWLIAEICQVLYCFATYNVALTDVEMAYTKAIRG